MAEWGECSNCGYEGFNDVYHWGTSEIECNRCGYEYLQTRAMKTKGREKRKGDKMSIFSWPKDMWDEKPKEKEPEKKAGSLLGELMVRQMMGEIQRKEQERQKEKKLQRAERERPNREITIGSKKHIVYQDNRRVIVINNPIINNYYGSERE